MGKAADDAAGIGAANSELDPDAVADGDRGGAELSITVADDDGTGTADDDGADRRDDGRTAGTGRRAGTGGGRRGGGGVRSAGSRKRAGGSKRKSASASGTREASLKVDRKPAARGTAKAAVPAKAFGDLAGVTFGIVAARRGPHWQLDPAESAAFGEALANVVRHVPLPERELGIAADIAALGFVVYAITSPRIEADRAHAARLAGAAAVPVAPATRHGLEREAAKRMEAVLADRLGGVPLDLRNPQHIAIVNQLADEGLVATGSAVGGGGQPEFTNSDPTLNGAIANDPNAVIEGLDPS